MDEDDAEYWLGMVAQKDLSWRHPEIQITMPAKVAEQTDGRCIDGFHYKRGMQQTDCCHKHPYFFGASTNSS
jgi:hypothetical protein